MLAITLPVVHLTSLPAIYVTDYNVSGPLPPQNTPILSFIPPLNSPPSSPIYSFQSVSSAPLVTRVSTREYTNTIGFTGLYKAFIYLLRSISAIWCTVRLCSQFGLIRPVSFLYTSDIPSVASKFGLLIQCYSHDTRRYFHTARNHTVAACYCLEEGIDAIYPWLSSNSLKLNPHKTDIMLCLSAKRCDSFSELPLSVGNVTVQPP